MSVDVAEAEALMKELRAAVDDFTPAWPKVERVVLDMERRQFETEGAYGGERWEPLNPSYAELKRREHGELGILRRNDVLFTSLTRKGALGHFYNAGPNFVEVGTTIPYGEYHQRGHESPTRLPRRKVIPTPPREIGEAIADILLAYILQRARRAASGGRSQ